MRCSGDTVTEEEGPDGSQSTEEGQDDNGEATATRKRTLKAVEALPITP